MKGTSRRNWRELVALLLLAGLLGPGEGATINSRERVLRLAFLEDPKTLDPALMMEEVNFELVPLLFWPLLDFSQVTNLFPAAAQAWSVSPDWKTFTFHLRPGLRFSTGRKVLASDFAFSLNRMADSRTSSPAQEYLMGIRGAADVKDGKTSFLSGIRLPDENTLVIELEHPDIMFPYVIATYGFALPPEAVGKPDCRFSTAPVYTGPYQVARFRRGDRLVLIPNSHFVGSKPHYDRVVAYLAVDEATQMMMFERGELDIIRIPFSQMKRTLREPRLRPLRESIPLLNCTFLIMNNEMEPLTDVRVRRAISYAVDSRRRVFASNGGYTPARGAIPPGMPGYDPEVKGYEYDPEKARALLSEAGVKLPLRLPLWYQITNPFTAALAQGIAADLHEIGIDLDLNGVTGVVLDEGTTHRRRVPLSINGWNVSLPDPKDMLGTQFDGRSIGDVSLMNSCFYNNPEVNRLLDLGSAGTDLEKRFARFREAQRIIIQDAPCAFLAHRNLFALRQPWVKGPLLDPLWWFRFDRVSVN